MKQNITKILLVASLLIIIDSFHIWRTATEFFLIGLIPGTDIKIAPGLMLMIMSVAIGIVIGSAFVMPLMRKYHPLNKSQVSR
jgi:hypothetical protein